MAEIRLLFDIAIRLLTSTSREVASSKFTLQFLMTHKRVFQQPVFKDNILSVMVKHFKKKLGFFFNLKKGDNIEGVDFHFEVVINKNIVKTNSRARVILFTPIW